jgi:hypothetical protein
LRYKTFYNIDINNYSNYDFIIDTSHATKDEVNDAVLSNFRAFEQGKEYDRILLSPKNLIMENETATDASDDIEIEKRDGKFYVLKGFAKVRAALQEGKNLVAVKKMVE